MRASELLGLPVRSTGGALLGTVVDVRLVQQGRLKGSRDALRIEGFVVGRHRITARLGYDRYERPGPALVRRISRWLNRHNGYLSWEQVDLDGDVVRATVDALEPLPPL